MGWTVNYLLLKGILGVILEGIGDICDTNGEAVYGRTGNNHPECGC